MRKLLMGLIVLVGATAAVSGARAASQAGPIPLAFGTPVAEPVHYDRIQYDEDWRHREWRRHEEFERWRRHREWRHERREEYGHRGW